mgnify:CR=1 FL=1
MKEVDLRLEILKYIREKGEADFFKMLNDLDLTPFDLAAELKALKDKGCIIIYEGARYSLTSEGIRELKQLEKPS